ncbi:SAM-dependent methyltransferase [Streptomyces rutgersensis]|uniref:SAM-dependent methyltransferase n=1 Tax=Streptomyces rutgersensis TaxID=53451 RepID=UPI001874617B|nr:SAM-dependent methyltransferase [Streptomyces rutgersensis]
MRDDGGNRADAGSAWASQDARRVAHDARVRDHWPGGGEHHALDAPAGERVAARRPGVRDVARADRAFLGRAVTHLARETGVVQFPGLGSGAPAVDHTREAARRVTLAARVVHVDGDRAPAHVGALLAGPPDGATACLEAEVRDPAVLAGAARTPPFSRPVAVPLPGVPVFVPGAAEARRVVRRLVAAVPAGSHAALDLGGTADAEAVAFWNAHAHAHARAHARAAPPATARAAAGAAAFLGGRERREPGVVSCPHPHPHPHPHPEPAAAGTLPARLPPYAAVAREP